MLSLGSVSKEASELGGGGKIAIDGSLVIGTIRLSSEDCTLALFVGFEVVWEVFEELEE